MNQIKMWRKEPKYDIANIEFKLQLGASQMSMLYIALIRNRSPQTNMHEFSKKKNGFVIANKPSEDVIISK